MNGTLPQGIKRFDRPLKLPRAGMIRLGEKQVSDKGREYPRELDHFNFTDAPLVGQVYGDNCRELDIIFPVNDPTAVFDTCYMAYGATGWKCRGNGDIAYNREHDQEIECAGEDCQMVSEGKCKRQGRLTFVCYKVPGLSVYQIVTSGWRSIENVLAFLEMLESLFGRIDGIPLKLYREPYESTYTDKDGKQRKQVHHCIRPDVAASLLDVKRLQLGGGQTLELPEATTECADDMYPEDVKQAEALPPAPEPEIIPALNPDIEIGFDILELSEQQRSALLAKYQGHDDKLIQYLSAMADRKQAPEARPEQKPTGTNGKPPHKNWF